jgi:FdhD protein
VEPHVAVTAIERVVGAGRWEAAQDELAVEEPLEIRVDGDPLAVTMRTPGEDEELAAGFLASEGLIHGPSDLVSVGPSEDLAANVVDVRTASGLRREAAGERRFYLSSSCGVCGKGALEFVRRAAPPSKPAPPLAPQLVLRLPERARLAQAGFARTGGLHATALFEVGSGERSQGEGGGGWMLALREDVGRHNAMDKAIGALLLEGRWPLRGVIGSLSGRAGFELVQKASVAGMAGLVAVGAPSTLAVELARERKMLLCGFVRDGSFNVYAGAEMVTRN